MSIYIFAKHFNIDDDVCCVFFFFASISLRFLCFVLMMMSLFLITKCLFGFAEQPQKYLA